MSEATELAVVTTQPPTGALADLQRHAMSVPSDVMREGLSEFKDRRLTFRKWLLEQFIEGVHYGVPPGCEPRGPKNDKQWKHKPALYKAGADFMCDLLATRDEYQADMDAWKQLGEPKETLVIRCRLYHKATGEFLGEGLGTRTVGEKKMGANASLKMAQKSAKVAACLNAWGLADLFSQDLDEEPHIVRHDNPDANPSAPKAATRGQRQQQNATPDKPRFYDDVVAMFREWKGMVEVSDGITFDSQDKARAAWMLEVEKGTGKSSLHTADAWTEEDVNTMRRHLGMAQ